MIPAITFHTAILFHVQQCQFQLFVPKYIAILMYKEIYAYKEKKSMAEIKKEQERDELHRAIWAIADELRGAVDG